jgi:intracellular septation protein
LTESRPPGAATRAAATPVSTPTRPKFPTSSLFWGGLLPIILFTLIEEYYGTLWGLIAALIFGVGEITFELWKYKKVSKITLISNGLIIFLGVISLFTQEGIWFKLQPAFLEFGMVVFLWGSLVLKKPFLLVLAEQQKINLPAILTAEFPKLTFRLGIFFLIHTGLAIWSALYWSTTHWALLKGIGLTVSMIVYLIAEMFFIRLKIQKS